MLGVRVFELCLSSPQSIKKNFALEPYQIVENRIEKPHLRWIYHSLTVSVAVLKMVLNSGPLWGLRPLTLAIVPVTLLSLHYVERDLYYYYIDHH